MNKEFTIKRLEQVRDVFVFCCFTALAFIDMKQLSRKHLIKDNNGALWIHKARQDSSIMRDMINAEKNFNKKQLMFAILIYYVFGKK